MDQTNAVPDMLDLLTQPAFYAKNGEITRINRAAAQLQFAPGTPLSQLLLTGQEEYSIFDGGELYLTVKAEDATRGATVTHIGETDVFLLDQQNEHSLLHAMSLAAQELRNPLSTFSITTDKLLSSLPADFTAAAAEQVAQLNRSLYQMYRLIGNMSSAEQYSKNAPVRTETCNIRAFFNELVDAAAAVCQGHRVLKSSGLSQDIFCLINKELLERAFYNLLSNAIKFSAQDSLLQVGLSRNRNTLYLTVENTPDGHTGSNFFNRYLREPGIQDGRCGIGLGMVLVHSAAAAHGGCVLVKQTAALTKVTVSLRIRQSSDNSLHSHVLSVDYAGERNHGLVELSDVLPSTAYKDI